MSLNARDVAEIMRLLEASSFDRLSLEMDGVKLSLERGGTPGAARTLAPPPPAAAPEPVAAPAAPIVADGDLAVTSPLLGTFYRAPKPGEPPFVEVGALVEPDTVIGIIEVMKLMNSVRAGVSGTVAAIAAADGALVEHGEILLTVRA